MKGIIIRTALFASNRLEKPAPLQLSIKKRYSPHDMRHYVAAMKQARVPQPELHQTFILCEAPTPHLQPTEFDFDMYHTMFDQERIIAVEDVMYPYLPTLTNLLEAWDNVHNFKPSPEKPGIVVTESIDRQFLLEEHETGMLADFIHLFSIGEIESIITVKPQPFNCPIDGTFVLAAKLHGGDWQPFYQFEEPWRVQSKILDA